MKREWYGSSESTARTARITSWHFPHPSLIWKYSIRVGVAGAAGRDAAGAAGAADANSGTIHGRLRTPP